MLHKELAAAGAVVEFIQFDGGHSIPPSALEALIKLLLTTCSRSYTNSSANA